MPIKTLHLLFLPLFIIVTVSCRDGSSVIDRASVPNIDVTGTELKADSMLYSSKIVAIFDQYILMPTWKKQQLFDLYWIKGDSLLYERSFLEEGNGPNELIIADYSYNPSNKQLLVEDPNTKKALFVDLAGKQDMRRCDAFSANPGYFFQQYIYETDSTVIGLVTQKGAQSLIARLNLLNAQCEVIEGLWPKDEFMGNPAIKQRVYTSNAILMKHPVKSLYFYAAAEGMYAEIFEINRKQAFNHQPIFSQYPVYDTKDGMNPSCPGDVAMGLHACATQAYIYIMLHRGTLQDFRNTVNKPLEKETDGYKYNNEIFVYNWQGVLQKIYHLNRFVNKFYVSDDDRQMWASCVNEETGEDVFLRFDL
ncbi:TolB-like 6-bladed beta-propeller domain-containing protein [Bacteroides fragilis]|uniref:BF3164 family lipoprotein n=1 Tax=Bacteroides fragilis TaxID=817 RepID=UPI001C3891F1|nr:BF3164 family lipoprotein [Bacteroides fragilis]MBV4191905.1 TolB-like 6-bladed beta-propeller domain-containing protein [Bacteroides fragilis]